MFEKTKQRLDTQIKQPVKNAIIVSIFAAVLAVIAFVVAVSK